MLSMGGCRCSYKTCVRATKNSDRDFHFFHYPVRDPGRCLKWIENARKEDFKILPEDQLRNKVVCQLHFEDHYFTNAYKRRLVHDAIPTLDGECETEDQKTEMNVQILKSDTDDNVFSVESTTLMHNEVGEVISYVFENGNVVPVDLSGIDTNSMLYKFCIPAKKTNENNEFVTTATQCDYAEDSQLIEVSQSQNQTNLLPSEDGNVADNQNRKSICYQHENNLHLCNNNTDIDVKNLSDTIKQHSKEIARLKRSLNVKGKQNTFKRFTTNRIIHHLQGLLPSTLHGAISLHLLKKNGNFTKDEKKFLVSLYNASPAAYDVLLKDCKWKLPDANVVKELTETKDWFR